ncbi:phosphatase PAP2 family protein [Bradyrhizobium sp. Arg68]|uniref:hypothetical protein n=1 Tax=Bradyrhizobium ivorense TaxID=2511166 RepID=UPI001E5524FD|nr:hypothetical protein [Bradyrhizobium ivorense]MCC8941006.1 phosphatase PAP2 family protein [Bradyrhizobium ivorense]
MKQLDGPTKAHLDPVLEEPCREPTTRRRSPFPKDNRPEVWAIGAVLVSTRILLLAHRASDVIAGLAIGAVLERLMRRLTGFGRSG